MMFLYLEGEAVLGLFTFGHPIHQQYCAYFQLDGSDRARLIHMSMYFAHRARCHQTYMDLLSMIHAKSSPLGHIRYMSRRAMQHWFAIGSELYGLPWSFNGQHEAAERMRRTLQELDRGPRTLEDTEANWVTELHTSRVLEYADKHPYWIDNAVTTEEHTRPRRIQATAGAGS
jgi:hypothetical protein